MTNKIVTMEADLLLLPLLIGTQKIVAMVDSGAIDNFLTTTMFDSIKSTMPEYVSLQFSAKPLKCSLADNTIILSAMVVLYRGLRVAVLGSLRSWVAV